MTLAHRPKSGEWMTAPQGVSCRLSGDSTGAYVSWRDGHIEFAWTETSDHIRSACCCSGSIAIASPREDPVSYPACRS